MDVCEVKIQRKYTKNKIGNDEFEDIIGYFNKEGLKDFNNRFKTNFSIDWKDIEVDIRKYQKYKFCSDDIEHIVTCRIFTVNKVNPIIDRWLDNVNC